MASAKVQVLATVVVSRAYLYLWNVVLIRGWKEAQTTEDKVLASVFKVVNMRMTTSHPWFVSLAQYGMLSASFAAARDTLKLGVSL